MTPTEFIQNLKSHAEEFKKLEPTAHASIAKLVEAVTRIASDQAETGALLRLRLTDSSTAYTAFIHTAVKEWDEAVNKGNLSQKSIKTHLETTKLILDIVKWQIDMATVLSKEQGEQDWSLVLASLGMITTVISSLIENPATQVAAYALALASLLDALKSLKHEGEKLDQKVRQKLADDVARRFFESARIGLESLRAFAENGPKLAETITALQEVEGIPAWKRTWGDRLQ